jgi:hypothetical protein
MNEFFQSAFQGKIVTMYEYFLVGSVLDHSKDGLIEILRGLCDNSETPPIEFTETECSFSFGKYIFEIYFLELLNCSNFNSNTKWNNY